MSNNFSGVFLLIVGPSGVGKGTTIEILKKENPDWVFPVSATTRSPRPGEKDGETYHFFTKEEFQKKIEAGDFLEWACVHGDNFYGALKSEIFPALEAGKVVLRELDIQGFESLRKIIPVKNLCSLFLLPPPRDILIKRIQSRAPISDEELENRLKSMEKEVSSAAECDFEIQTIDGHPEYSAEKIEKIVEDLRKKRENK